MYIHDALLRKKLTYLPLLVVTKVKKKYDEKITIKTIMCNYHPEKIQSTKNTIQKNTIWKKSPHQRFIPPLTK